MEVPLTKQQLDFIIVVLCLILINSVYLLYKEKTEFDFKCGIQTNFNGDIKTYTWRPELTTELKENESNCLRICHSTSNISFAEIITNPIP